VSEYSGRAGTVRLVAPRGRWAFAVLLSALLWMLLVQFGLTVRGDLAFMLACRRWATALPGWVTQAFLWATWLGDYPRRAIIILLCASVLWLARQRRAALVIVIAILLVSPLIDGPLKQLSARPRPEIVPWLTDARGFSLPSGHALGAAFTFALIALLIAPLLHRRAARAALWTVMVVLTLAVGVSRVWLGVHWPSDVVAGWLVGGGAAWLAASFVARLPAGAAPR
jgi:undecaprenyl-diphosphatase